MPSEVCFKILDFNCRPIHFQDPKELKIKVPKQTKDQGKSKSPRYRSTFLSVADMKKLEALKDRHEKQLLGELHEDKRYLKQFLDDEGKF